MTISFQNAYKFSKPLLISDLTHASWSVSSELSKTCLLSRFGYKMAKLWNQYKYNQHFWISVITGNYLLMLMSYSWLKYCKNIKILTSYWLSEVQNQRVGNQDVGSKDVGNQDVNDR